MRPGLPRFSRSSASVYSTECKPKNKKRGRPGNEARDEHNAPVYPPPIPRRITYWLQFLESHHVPGTTAPHVIIIGSHKDILKRQQPKSYKTKVSAIESFVKGKVMSDTSLHFAGFFAVDCR